MIMRHKKVTILISILIFVSILIIEKFGIKYFCDYEIDLCQSIPEPIQVPMKYFSDYEIDLSHSITEPIQVPIKYFSDYERDLCQSVTEPIQVPTAWKTYCPEKAIVTVSQLGRLGNQMWEYASVWAIARKSDHEPYVPRCIIRELEEVFENLTIPPLSYIAHCPVYKNLVTPSTDKLVHTNEDILLPDYAQLPEHVIPDLHEVLKLFKFKQSFQDESQRILHSISRNVTQAVYVAVHVRRTDYTAHLKFLYNLQLAEPQYFLSAMEYFRNKYKSVLFIVVSDDTDWCFENLQRGQEDVFVVNTSNPGQDLAFMAACNHSIIDYGTFGTWGAAMAGGETILYNVTWGLEITMSQMIPNWHAVN